MRLKEALDYIIENKDLLQDEPIWKKTDGGMYEVHWFLDRQKPSVEADYSFDEERFGITKDGQLIWGFDSGCS